MSEPFLGEIRVTSFSFAPKGWAMCNGQLLPINQNQALFALLGTQYGGNGQTTFALPDLRGRSPIHTAAGFVQGQTGGEEAHLLTSAEIPAHTHAQGSAAQATGANPANNVLAAKPRRGSNVYASTANVALAGQGSAGGNQSHGNMQPYLTLNFVIALQGIFPSRN
ncbi:phage tail protein [Sulfurirhabdus autotrophica]|uniref:Microcystin-dependent protein n=1 Tax=Sulfurirhabdus autotrophica TaxID=1706046 RepID=A0A4R3YBB7_9PROT|nr:tail fiber protein [Sulfurirhabdus autotrophica]TCV89021.1 microcystin-dependent protein [Sulfurirhabdus autotrophica]